MLRSQVIAAGLLAAVATAAALPLAPAADIDEFKVKRQEVFEFAERPQAVREGDRVTITFASQGFCDATVAIEGADGRIVRHLACGVLGPNAPEPLQRGVLKQTLVWDGKDDQGRYVDDKDSLAVRVSLGLDPRLAKTLFWHPAKRVGAGRGHSGVDTTTNLPTPLVRAAPEGVYVFEGHGVDHLRLFDHEGNYLKTVYPFAAAKVQGVEGISWHLAPQDQQRVPHKDGFLMSTLLTSGSTWQNDSYVRAMFGTAATAMAVRDGKIALTLDRLNRLATDGTTGGLKLEGPPVTFDIQMTGMNIGHKTLRVAPTSLAFSPDGQWLYMAGYMWRAGIPLHSLKKDCLHGVVRLAYAGNAPPELFVGSMTQDDSGSDNRHFTDATAVACDAQGRVYVADYMNDRVQVYAPNGKHLKTIAARKPVRLAVDPRSGELWVFSWVLLNDSTAGKRYQDQEIPAPPTLTRHGPFDDPRPLRSWPLPLDGHATVHNRFHYWGGLEHYAEIDFWAKEPTLWLATGNGKGRHGKQAGALSWDQEVGHCLRLLVEKNGQWEVRRNFGREVEESVAQTTPPYFWRQRLYLNPATGLLYVGEGQPTINYKAFCDVVEIDPVSGRCRMVELPFDCEDMAFDINGLAYLRLPELVARYDPATWREVPFDYGEQRSEVTFSSSKGEGRRATVLGALGLPKVYRSHWHNGGMWVSPKGHVAVASLVHKDPSAITTELRTDEAKAAGIKEYVPRLFPGRLRLGEVNVFDKHGQMLYEDAIPGIDRLHCLAIDKDDNLYALPYEARMFDGQQYFNLMTGTLMKCKPQAARFQCAREGAAVPIPFTTADRPRRPADAYNDMTREVWVEGVAWQYGGLGFTGKGSGKAMGGCACWNTRFALDYFGRTFAPETDHYSVAVLDTNGNLILRIGRYGNIDDGRPLDLAGGLPNPRSIGGDEVSLFHACYLAAHTDRRLFIADSGNARIASVQLGYHATERVALSSVPDRSTPRAPRLTGARP